MAGRQFGDVELRTFMLFRFCGIHVVKQHADGFFSCWISEGRKRRYFDLQPWQVQDMIGQLSFVSQPEDMDVRLETIHGFHAADGLLSDYPFGYYLMCEKQYMAFLNTKNDAHLEKLASWLYLDKVGLPAALADKDFSLEPFQLLGTLFWFMHVKKQFSMDFPHFFKPVSSMGKGYSFMESLNAQIRALTDGDVTKEEAVKAIGCRRALTELDAKALEAEEFKKKYGNK